MCVCACSSVWFFVTPWTEAHQAPLSMGFPRQEYWSGLPFPSLGDLPDPEIEPASPALTGGFFYRWATREGLQKNIDMISGLRHLASIKKFKQTNKPKAKFDNWLGILSGRPGPTNTVFWQDSIFCEGAKVNDPWNSNLDWQEPRDLAEKILTPFSQASCQLGLTWKTFFSFQFHYRAELLTTLTTRNSLVSW